jgi:hypothetical protein
MERGDPDDIAADRTSTCCAFLLGHDQALPGVEGGTYIYSNSEAYDLKQTDNLQKLMNGSPYLVQMRGWPWWTASWTSRRGSTAPASGTRGPLAAGQHISRSCRASALRPSQGVRGALSCSTLLPEKGRVIDLDRDI